MANHDHIPPLPSLDDMLQPLLLLEEGEHEFSGEEEGVTELRELFFPVTRHCTYLNHAANGPLPRPTARTLHDYVDDTSVYGNINFERWSAYESGSHRRLAQLIHARPDQVAFTYSTGDGFMTIAQGLNWQEGDIILSAEGEFPSNVYPWLNLEELGVRYIQIPARNHRIVVEDIVANITERTRLVTLSLVEFSTGFRNDIAALARHCHERGVLCGIDAMQALGSIDINVQELDVDYLSGASHKWLLGPQICGILYISDRLLPQLRTPRRGWLSVETPFDFFNHNQPLRMGAGRFEHSSSNRLPIIGMDASLGVFEALAGGMQAVEARILGLTGYVIAGLERLGYPVVSPQGAGERSGIVCFKPHPERQDMSIHSIVDELAARSIYVAARSDVVRISPHFYNSLEELDRLLNALEEMMRDAA
ncbi:MAG TPA: aminotransferase class V-fold PLP-dependent enzyme [Ktedonobacteraceae bacterium]|jgi:cysteine desulfurase/selenocysteine lyase|nr:aminotransferase class V-fold PLP-dependent enzyme [Ktedonobacteraceae bacterium]